MAERLRGIYKDFKAYYSPYKGIKVNMYEDIHRNVVGVSVGSSNVLFEIIQYGSRLLVNGKPFSNKCLLKLEEYVIINLSGEVVKNSF